MPFANETIWIIGASTGIGRALSILLSNNDARLILSARSEDKLIALQQQLGKHHRYYVLDVSDPKAVESTVLKISANTDHLHRVIFLAGIYQQSNIINNDPAFAYQCLNTNLLGAMYISYALLPILSKQKSGQLVFCASIAGKIGLPGGQPYSASKAGLINFAESLYAETDRSVDIKLITPGFVKTRLTDKNDFNMPFIITPEQAAAHIARGLRRSSFEIHFPKYLTVMIKCLCALPYPIKLFITRYFSSRE